MSQTQQSTANHSSRFTDGEFQPNRPKSADNLLMEYLCVVKQRKIPIDEYKEYVEGQSETIREINVIIGIFVIFHFASDKYFHFICVASIRRLFCKPNRKRTTTATSF